MESNLIEINDLHVVYETDDAMVYAVNGLTLSVKNGETLGLVGETGAGKTTTALSIMKLLPEKIGFITNGSIVFENKKIIKLSEADMRLLRGNSISMIFQDPMTSLNPVLTIADQLMEVLKIHNREMTKEQMNKKTDEILALVGLPAERKHEYPHQFSGGMKQRVVIAIALACQPKLLLADEPTTALDVTIQAQVLQLMKDLKKKIDTAMILITHDLGVVAQTCDRVAIMYAGEIIEIGTVADIFDGEHHHPYTSGLFGSIPNMSKTTRRLNPIEGLMPDPTIRHKGCCFSPRCPQKMDICEDHKPDDITFDSHLVKCHLYSKNTGTKGSGL